MNSKRTALVIAVFTMAALALPLGAAPDAAPWFDLEKCSMCKNMTAEKGLMEHMEWENHLIADGMMSITVVTAGYEEAFARSMENMKATGEKLMAGEKMYLCGFCQSYGGLHMAGANFEHIETKSGTIELITSRERPVRVVLPARPVPSPDEYNKMVAAESHGEHPSGEHTHGDH